MPYMCMEGTTIHYARWRHIYIAVDIFCHNCYNSAKFLSTKSVITVIII